ncbi:hypothetical protein [Cryobacterium sp. GrIS_2_6]|uniref:hypothetical protein n=1 Tax=Cryobacterium sp. GrIS_2_6 TaxID=3162785 RepID=UPI002DF905BF|nr:hypothetical protein [Cryobacterium psychrotolerans]
MALIKWWIPKKKKGRKLANPGYSFEAELIQVLTEAARAETILQGKKVAPSVMAANLILRNGNVFIPVRSTLLRNYLQLKRETDQHETSTKQTSTTE